MATNHVETPGIPSGNEKQQLEQMFRYLSRLADDLNVNLDAIGGNELNDEERTVMQQILAKAAEDAGIPEEDAAARAGQEMESLKSLIIKTASFVQTKLDEMRTNLIGETVAEGKFGKYVRRTGLDMVVTPEGVTQNYTLQDIVTGLSNYEVNAKNYIKTGLLRTVNGIPVYGVAIGKDVVTFTQNGQEIYNDGNKVAELTAEELSFWQNVSKVFYITAGKLHASGDFEIDAGKKLKIVSGADLDVQTANFILDSVNKIIDIKATNFTIDSANKRVIAGIFTFGDKGLLIDKDDSFSHLKTRFVVASSQDADFTGRDEGCGILYDYSVGSTSQGGTYYIPYIVFTDKNKTHKLMFELPSSMGGASIYLNSSTKKLSLGSNSYPIQNLIVNNIASAGTNPILGTYGNPFTNAYFTNAYCAKAAPIGGGGTGSIGDSTAYWKDAYVETVHSVGGGSIISSREKKHNIEPMKPPGDRLDQLKPVTFIYNSDKYERTRQGLIYEDTVEVMPEICSRPEEKEKGIVYTELIPMLLKEIQELRARVKTLEEGR